MTGCSATSPFTFNIPAFRGQFTAFANVATYPDDALQIYFDTAESFIANPNYGYLRNCANLLALNLMTAHLVALGKMIRDGQTPGVETQATIDKVSVSMMEPPVGTQFQYWLSQTPYGAELLALLQAKSVGGFYQPGGLGRAGFRAAFVTRC